MSVPRVPGFVPGETLRALKLNKMARSQQEYTELLSAVDGRAGMIRRPFEPDYNTNASIQVSGWHRSNSRKLVLSVQRLLARAANGDLIEVEGRELINLKLPRKGNATYAVFLTNQWPDPDAPPHGDPDRDEEPPLIRPESIRRIPVVVASTDGPSEDRVQVAELSVADGHAELRESFLPPGLMIDSSEQLERRARAIVNKVHEVARLFLRKLSRTTRISPKEHALIEDLELIRLLANYWSWIGHELASPGSSPELFLHRLASLLDLTRDARAIFRGGDLEAELDAAGIARRLESVDAAFAKSEAELDRVRRELGDFLDVVLTHELRPLAVDYVLSGTWNVAVVTWPTSLGEALKNANAQSLGVEISMPPRRTPYSQPEVRIASGENASAVQHEPVLPTPGSGSTLLYKFVPGVGDEKSPVTKIFVHGPTSLNQDNLVLKGLANDRP